MNEKDVFFEEILRLAFEKVEEDTGEIVFSRQTQELSILIKGKKKTYGEKTYERYFNKYVLKKNLDEVKNPTMDVFNGLLLYLDYENFKGFKEENAHLINGEQPSIKKKSLERVSQIKVEEKKLEEKTNKPIEVTIKNSFKINKVLLYCAVAITVLIGIFVFNDVLFNENKLQPKEINYNRYTGDLNFYYSKNDKTGEIKFYDNDDVPKNNDNYKPATQEIILTHFKLQNKEVTEADKQRWFKVENKTIEDNDIKMVNKSPIKTAELVVLKKIVVINNNSVKDNLLSAFFEKEYNKTSITYNALGTVSYTYKKSSFSDKMVVCNLELSYKVYLSNASKAFDINTITVSASGFSNSEAKMNTIKKLKFN